MVIFLFPIDIHHSSRFLSYFPSDQPIVASFPHFYARPGKFLEKLDGLHPRADKHRSYTIIEPTLGVPLNQRAVSQSNVVTKDLSAFKADIARFSNMVIPMFWIEYVRPSIMDAKFQGNLFLNIFSI
jgi:CD36 family